MSDSGSVDGLACSDAVHRRAKVGFAVLLRIKLNLPKEYSLSIPDDESFVIGALTQHGNHLNAHTIEQTHRLFYAGLPVGHPSNKESSR